MWKKQSALVAKSKIIPLTMSHNYQAHNRECQLLMTSSPNLCLIKLSTVHANKECQNLTFTKTTSNWISQSQYDSINEWMNEWFSFPSNKLLFLFYFLTIIITNTKGNSYSNHTSHCWLWCRCLPAHSCNSSTLSCLCVIGKASQFIRVCTLSRDNFPGLFQDFKYT